MLTDPSWQNRENWIRALKEAEDRLEIASKELDVVIESRFNGASDEYTQAYAVRKNLRRIILDMRIAYQRGDNYLVWKLSHV